MHNIPRATVKEIINKIIQKWDHVTFPAAASSELLMCDCDFKLRRMVLLHPEKP